MKVVCFNFSIFLIFCLLLSLYGIRASQFSELDPLITGQPSITTLPFTETTPQQLYAINPPALPLKLTPNKYPQWCTQFTSLLIGYDLMVILMVLNCNLLKMILVSLFGHSNINFFVLPLSIPSIYLSQLMSLMLQHLNLLGNTCQSVC